MNRPPPVRQPRLRIALHSTLAALLLGVAAAGASAVELTVSAAASLANAFTAIAREFETQHPGIKVQSNFAASGALLQQIAKGAPVDVFASADEETMDQAERQQLVTASERADFASNSLLLIVTPSTAALPRSLADLATPAFNRVAIGVPASVPAGRYAKAALAQAGLWTAVEPKLIGAQSVRQVLDYVARGEVDAGFVYATDAALMPGKVRPAFTVATPTPVRYPIAPVAASANPAAARRFVAFVVSPPAQAVLAKYGFGKP